MGTETAIMEAMNRLMHGRTTFMIAHRLSTLKDCDLLLVIEQGRLVEVRSDVSAAIGSAVALGGADATFHGGRASVQAGKGIIGA
jgi:ATP-binding cassette subfamily B protein